MIVVFTDLDGTLLNSDYRWNAAAPALGRLKTLGIPVVLVTSKTLAEVEAIRLELANESPFVIENGGAAFAPKGQLQLAHSREEGEYRIAEFGMPCRALLQILLNAAQEARCTILPVAHMSLEDWSNESGLPVEQAKRARLRRYDEPFRLVEGDLEALRLAVEQRGARLIQGGRFLHVTGTNDKATAVSVLLDAYRRRGTVHSIGLGDAPNDLGFLRLMDQPVVLASPFAAFLHREVPQAILAPSGPAGWNQAVLDLISELEPSP